MVGGIDIDNVKWSFDFMKPNQGIAKVEMGRGLEFKIGNISLKAGEGLGVFFDESAFLRAARECLDPHRASAGKKIQEVGAVDMGAEDVKEGLSHTRRGWTGVGPIRARQSATAKRAAAYSDSHFLVPQPFQKRPNRHH